MPLILVLAIASFAAGLSQRMFDPMVTEVARDLAVAPTVVALLSTAFALPYAAVMPFVGGLGDTIGKVRVIQGSVTLLALTLVLTALAPDLSTLFVVRALVGMANAGIFALAMGVIGDRVPFEKRQVALSYLLMAVLSAQLFGMPAVGLIASTAGWRVVGWIVAGFACVAVVATMMFLKPRPALERPPFDAGRITANYLSVLAMPTARICFASVFVEGLLVFGFIPFVAVLLEARGAGGTREAGLVLTGMGVGGFIYTFNVRRLLDWVGGMYNVMRLGGSMVAIGFFTLAIAGPWQLDALAFAAIGVGFYMLHGSLQTEVTEVAPDNRATSTALHAFFFILGQSFGPIFFTLMLPVAGPRIGLVSVGCLLIALGFAAAKGLEQRRNDASAAE